MLVRKEAVYPAIWWDIAAPCYQLQKVDALLNGFPVDTDLSQKKACLNRRSAFRGLTVKNLMETSTSSSV